MLTGVRLPKWIVDWIKSQERSGGRVIEDALTAYYKLQAPFLSRRDTTKRKRGQHGR
jgi:hypothetical protein